MQGRQLNSSIYHRSSIYIYINEPPHDRTNKMACAPSDSAQSDQSLRCPHHRLFSYDFIADYDCYRVRHARKLWDMFNEVFREHQQTSPYCEGRLDFDYANEEQRQLCWREKVICDRCQYVSQRYNLYDEIETGKPGRKPATANAGSILGWVKPPLGQAMSGSYV